MRPRGDIARALHGAAMQGPGTVTQLAHRAQVGVPMARYTASRMVQRGELVQIEPGRPAVLGAARPVAAGPDWLDVLQRRFHAGLQQRGPSRADERGQQFACL